MGTYSALMKDIEQGLEEIRKTQGKVVEITRTGKVISEPFVLFKDEGPQEAPANT